MIVIQEKLGTVFSRLPEIGGIKPTYQWGNELHLLKILELYQKESVTPYPLIYQISNTTNQNYQSNEVTFPLELILAVRNTQTDQLNPTRWQETFGQLLYPLCREIEKTFMVTPIFLWDKEYTLREFPNYGSGTENFTIDKWDALRLETTITIQGNVCL